MKGSVNMNKQRISVIRSTLSTFILLLLFLASFNGCFFLPGSAGKLVVPNLTVKGAPSDVSAVSLVVTGPGMNPVKSYFSPVPGSITVEVPAGKDRLFELVAYVDPASPSAVISFKGTATANLVAGESESIELEMVVGETKLVIPDLQGSIGTSRLVQIDDLSGAGWVELVGTDVGWGTNFRPYDVDFDSQGRIYVANYNALAGYGRAFRIDDIAGTNFTTFPDKATQIMTVAVDRYNDYLYYASSSALWRVELDGTNDTTLTPITGIQTFRGMAVADNGFLYVAGTNPLGNAAVFRYDPIAQNVTDTYTTSLNNVWDAFARMPYVYVANHNGAAGDRILQLDEFLSFVDGYGDPSPSADNVVGNFYGPKRFVGILPKKLVILDERSTNEPPFPIWLGDRLVSIEDLNGTGWQTYGTTGSGVGQFNFYWAC
jgi:hypothetical protein